MGKINEQDLLDEIRFDIRQNDLIKARLVLSAIENVSRKTQKQALFEVSRAEDDFSIPLLAGVLADSPDISELFPHLKETMFSKILDSPKVLSNMLSKADGSAERAFLAEIAGEIRLVETVPILLDILKAEEDPNAIKAIIRSLGMIGDPFAISEIIEYLNADRKDIVIASLCALGDLGTAEAIKSLTKILGHDSDLDLMAIDIIGRAQLPEALEILNDLLSSKSAHLRTAAKQKLGEIGIMSVRILCKNLFVNDVDLIIHSLNVLGDLCDEAAIPAIRRLLFYQPKDPNIRFAAYEALGRLPLDKGAFTLASGLEDPVDNVRNAAAKAIDRNYNPVLAGGVRNLVSSGDAQALSIIITIINSQCNNIFLDLIEEDYFKGPAIKYLAGKAHPETRSVFSRIMAEAGYDELSKQFDLGKSVKRKGKVKVFAIDDSKMILTIYRTILFNLGYESQLFEFPVKALEQINRSKPDIILTDLNMPDITGIDFTKRVRRSYSKEELPIIMVTTQDESSEREVSFDAGVNSIIQKPFTERQIREALKNFTV